jgi:hypothetical protein
MDFLNHTIQITRYRQKNLKKNETATADFDLPTGNQGKLDVVAKRNLHQGVETQ